MSHSVGQTASSSVVAGVGLLGEFSNQLPDFSWSITQIASSSSLFQLFSTTALTLPYVFLRQSGIQGVSQFISSRFIYLECLLTNLASIVHHAVAAFFYACTSLAMLGFADSFNQNFSKHSGLLIYAFGASGIGLLGVLSPYYAFWITLLFGSSIFSSTQKSYDRDVFVFEAPFVRWFKSVYGKHVDAIFDFWRCRAKDDEDFEKRFKPSLEEIWRLIASAHRMDDLYKIGRLIRDKWPEIQSSESEEEKSEVSYV